MRLHLQLDLIFGVYVCGDGRGGGTTTQIFSIFLMPVMGYTEKITVSVLNYIGAPTCECNITRIGNKLHC